MRSDTARLPVMTITSINQVRGRLGGHARRLGSKFDWILLALFGSSAAIASLAVIGAFAAVRWLAGG